jgi:hypothetical protein
MKVWRVPTHLGAPQESVPAALLIWIGFTSADFNMTDRRPSRKEASMLNLLLGFGMGILLGASALPDV